MELLQEFREAENDPLLAPFWYDYIAPFESLLARHLSYLNPLTFSIPLVEYGGMNPILEKIARRMPLESPTSLMARGTYYSGNFRWANSREVYEIILDEIASD